MIYWVATGKDFLFELFSYLTKILLNLAAICELLVLIINPTPNILTIFNNFTMIILLKIAYHFLHLFLKFMNHALLFFLLNSIFFKLAL